MDMPPMDQRLDVTIIQVSEEREVIKVGDSLALGETTAKFVLAFPSRNGHPPQSFVVSVPPEAVTEYAECTWDRYRVAHPELNLPVSPDSTDFITKST